MRALSRVLGSSMSLVVAVGVIGGATASTAAAATSDDISAARLGTVDYREGLLSAHDARAFLGSNSEAPHVKPVGAGSWNGAICNESLVDSQAEVAGRSVQHDTSSNASLLNYVVSFEKEKNAKNFVDSAKSYASTCAGAYAIGSSVFTPGTQVPTPKIGEQRMGFSGTFTFPGGQNADSVQLMFRQGQHVVYAQMLSVAPITKQIITSVSTAMGKRLAAIEHAAATSKKPAKVHASKVTSCDKLVTTAQLQKAFGAALKDPANCSWDLAQGAGGVDVLFVPAKQGADRTFAHIAEGEPVSVKGAADALYSSSTNQFGQVSETIYVRTKRGDTFSIGLRGDDAPKNQKQGLIVAANAAEKKDQG